MWCELNWMKEAHPQMVSLERVSTMAEEGRLSPGDTHHVPARNYAINGSVFSIPIHHRQWCGYTGFSALAFRLVCCSLSSSHLPIRFTPSPLLTSRSVLIASLTFDLSLCNDGHTSEARVFFLGIIRKCACTLH
ncbi:hypothetical protein GOP47_0000795 [Adiantum capillus-veneris]|uniref:Uncharacterized protein n=1 Tax=Adiantum capillus-veneris TaxID=13818 RepID=A0A9D4ZSM1_ADICA|nr:hypothetical protein GOP47_0000795 [Adiantum capillus-veneris]